MKILLLLCLNFLVISLYSQAGLNMKYIYSDYSNIEADIEINEKFDIFKFSYGAGLFYFHNVNGKGIVLMPEIGYDFANTSMDDGRKFSLQKISVGVPIKFYPFNLEGDCGCPDFSIRNKFFEKHFFLLLNNSIFWNIKKLSSQYTNIKDSYFSGKIGLGAGISLPVTDKIGIEPTIAYNWGFHDVWKKDFLYVRTDVNKTINFTDLDFSLRIKYNWE